MPPHDWTVKLAQAKQVVGECENITELARKLGVSRTTLRDALNREENGAMSFAEFKANAATSEDVYHGIPASTIIRFLRKQPRTRREISAYLDRSEETVVQIVAAMQKSGYSITSELSRLLVPPAPVLDDDIPHLFGDGKTTPSRFDVTFGVLSDTHAGSKSEQVTALRDYTKIAVEEFGVRHFLHAGDALAGFGVYRGQMTDLYETTGAGQARAAMYNLPFYPGVKWWILGGNHGYSFYRAVGLDARREMLRDHPEHGLTARDDITLLPFDAATIPLTHGIDVHLWHPAGGIPYAYSYRGQRAADQLAFDELMEVTVGQKPKPTLRFLLIGHMHVMYSFFAGPIFVIGAGCFEGRNSYLMRKGLVPHIGGWILKCTFIDNFLHRVSPTAIRYQEIDNDWQPWYARRTANGRQIIEYEPIYNLNSPTVTGAMMTKEGA